MLRILSSAALVGLALACTGSTASAQARPSFDCAMAREADEVAICSDPDLARADVLHARTYASDRVRDRREADQEARESLATRHGCANDRLCILDALVPSHSDDRTAWLRDYRRRLVQEVARDDLTPKSYAKLDRPQSFTTSNHGVQATLVRLSGLDGRDARAHGEVLPADDAEECFRNAAPGNHPTHRQCARHSPGIATSFDSAADCPARVLRLWDGTWRLVGFDGDGTPDWLSPDGDRGPAWNGRSTPDAHFDLLCPNTLARLRARAAR